MKLSEMSLTELTVIETELPLVIATKKAAEAEKVKEVLAKTAEKHGYTLADIFGDAKSRRSMKVLPKYRDPNSGKTWSGRGRAPLWMPKRKTDYTKVAI